MHHSDTLVLGPLPVAERSIRLPLVAVFLASPLVVVVVTGAVTVLAWPRAIGLPVLGAQMVKSTPTAADDIKWLTSAPEGADVVLDDKVV